MLMLISSQVYKQVFTQIISCALQFIDYYNQNTMDSPVPEQVKTEKQESKAQQPEEKNQHDDDAKGQSSRRSRKDVQGRDFVCGCGKKYLSYPALYTHIKTKHDGRQPEGTMKYSTTAPAKKNKSKIQQQHLAEMITMVKREDIKFLDVAGQKCQGRTPTSSRIKSKILTRELTEAYNTLTKGPLSPLKVNKDSPLEHHLIIYLVGVGEYVPQKLQQQYQWFAKTVRDCYYQMGTEVYQKCFSKKQGGLCYIPKFKVERVKYMPIICDFYIRFYLPYEHNELNSNLMELILTDFCKWLSKRKCTYIEINLNKDYQLKKPLVFEESEKNPIKREYSQVAGDDNKQEISQNMNNQSVKQGEPQIKCHQNEEKHKQNLVEVKHVVRSENGEGKRVEEKIEQENNLKEEKPTKQANQQIVQETPQDANQPQTQKPNIELENKKPSQEENKTSNKAQRPVWSIQAEPGSQSQQEVPEVKEPAQNDKAVGEKPNEAKSVQQNEEINPDNF